MGILMIRCSKTGRAISTGTYVESAAFRSSPVFFGQTYCPHCDATHEWLREMHGSAILHLSTALSTSDKLCREHGKLGNEPPMSEKVISKHQAVEMRCPLLPRLCCKTLIETIDEHQERSPLDRATSLNSQIERYRRARATRAPAIRKQDKDSHRPQIVRLPRCELSDRSRQIRCRESR
jgi:hypothetical protein